MSNIIPQKRCTQCNKPKPLDEFYSVSKSGNPQKRRTICITCISLRKPYANLTPEQKRHFQDLQNVRRKAPEFQLKRRIRQYGLTLEQYNAVVESQGNVCAICGKPETKIDHRNGVAFSLCMDHDHQTGKFRGLLCNKCNRRLGRIEWHMRQKPFMDYLRKSQ